MIVDAGPISCLLAKSTKSHFLGTNPSVPGTGQITILKNGFTDEWKVGRKVLFRSLLDTETEEYQPVSPNLLICPSCPVTDH